MGLGTPVLPRLPKHAGDRNRTSPFAFTGNKFEFRAVGSTQSISWPSTVLNTIVAESVEELTNELETELKKKGATLEDALHAVLNREIPRIKHIMFNGDGYSQEWQDEAKKRGLLNLRTTLDALAKLKDEKNLALFEKYNVLTRRELESREEIAYDQYFKTVNIEGETTAEMARTMILPAAVRYLNELSRSFESLKAVHVRSTGISSTVADTAALIDELVPAIDKLTKQNAELGGDSVHSKAHHMRDNIVPAMLAVRDVCDRLEKVIPDDLWPLPRYREMLFIK